jgi:hypothetical protein
LEFTESIGILEQNVARVLLNGLLVKCVFSLTGIYRSIDSELPSCFICGTFIVVISKSINLTPKAAVNAGILILAVI